MNDDESKRIAEAYVADVFRRREEDKARWRAEAEAKMAEYWQKIEEMFRDNPGLRAELEAVAAEVSRVEEERELRERPPLEETKNHEFAYTEDARWTTLGPVEAGRLDALREEAQKYEIAFRSCWQCNGAHAHFLQGEWGEWVCACITGCGRYYYKGVDITEHGQPPQESSEV